MIAPPTTIHVAACLTCGAIASADTRAEAAKRTTCPMCPAGDGVLQVFRYQLAPQKSRNAQKSRAKDHR
jgi:hypothetical protein